MRPVRATLGTRANTERIGPVTSQVAAGDAHTCALTTAGGVECWGYNTHGQLGDGSTTSRTKPVAVSGLPSGVAAIAASDYHTCALTTAGGVECWGWNVDGQLGDGSTNSSTPVAVSGLASGVVAITAGQFHTCALTTAGGVQCWGRNNFGQLGDGSTTDRTKPVAVSGLASGVAAITAGGAHTCALTTAGGVLCWGYNNKGQLGDGSITNSPTPVAVSGLASGVAAMAAGDSHNCVLTPAGGVQCWGKNDLGQLGDGSTTNRTTPVTVSGLASGVAAITAGGAHTCALTTANRLQCWGGNVHSQLGDGSTIDRRVPVTIRAGQSITFKPPLSLGLTAEFVDLAASVASGRAVSFDTWTPNICDVAGNSLIILHAPEALCGIRASQAGGTRAAGGSDAPAPQQLRLIRITDVIFANGFDN